MNESAALPSPEWFVLARATSLHAGHLDALRKRKEPVASLVGRPPEELRALGVPPGAAARIAAPDHARIEADRRWAEAAGVRLVGFEAREFPPLLKQIADAPLALWVRGDAAALAAPQVALVGSRHPTAGGVRHASGFARELGAFGFVITSGLARGIDAAAHEGALAGGGRTVAVCGTGLDDCYPARNAPLAERIARAGALVSEFPPGTEPRAEHFPRRNRIISGLSRGVLVVEAALDSGSLITARLAGEQGRHVMALPGSIDSPVSRGCHRLIREGVVLVQTVAEVLQELGCTSDRPLLNQILADAPEPPAGRARLDKAGEMLLDALGFEPASVDDLIARTGLSAPEIAIGLGRLSLEGLVEMLPGGRYGRLPLPPLVKVN